MPHTLAGFGLATALLGGLLCAGTSANASVTPFGGGGSGAGSGSGNGSHNRNSFIVNSPNWSRDIQHVRNVNVSGVTITPAAVCKRPVRHCRIIQKVVFIDP